ncbi:MAG: hypothetical protein KF712_13975 [Akkermansiaceae bacterium]|nr:hypothetical protein [Akkermansiaceae bacterium]
MYEGQTVEFLMERHWNRQERARFMRSRSHRGFHAQGMFWVVMLACVVGLAALVASVFFL